MTEALLLLVIRDVWDWLGQKPDNWMMVYVIYLLITILVKLDKRAS